MSTSEKTPTLRQSKLWIVMAVAAVFGATIAIWWPGRADTRLVVDGAPVGYQDLSELLTATNTTVIATVVSEPRDYVDYGADGKPDFEGEAGWPIQLVTVNIDRVLRGDQSLAGSTISVSQPSPKLEVADGSRESDRIQTQQTVLIVGNVKAANPGVGETNEIILNPAPWGYGIYDMATDRTATTRVDGLFEGTVKRGTELNVEAFSASP